MLDCFEERQKRALPYKLAPKGRPTRPGRLKAAASRAKSSSSKSKNGMTYMWLTRRETPAPLCPKPRSPRAGRQRTVANGRCATRQLDANSGTRYGLTA
jgi:hypothetical protein